MQSGRERPPSTTCLSVRAAARRVAHVPDVLRLRHQIMRAARAHIPCRSRRRRAAITHSILEHTEAVEEIDVEGILAFAARFTARRGPLGASLPRSKAAAPAAILPGRDRLRRKSIQSNRRNGTAFQVLGAG